ncbi:MAG: TetR/AcrR family transcriptional regulator [Dehalococcoidia bacterium]|nr:TetR/AcrR family transcriptional regulator [Dehalococcoidia bacterium]
MPVKERTQSEAQRRQQILAAARLVFDEKGYESATISEIVKKAGVAQGTFYLYFSSKKDIVVDLARKPMADMAVRLQHLLNGEESFAQVLRLFVRTGFEVGYENPDLCRLMHMGSERTEAHKQLESESEVMRMVIDMFHQAIDAGDMVPVNPEIASGMFHAIIAGALQLTFATDPPPASRQEICRETEEIIVRAFAAHQV